jgi:hypothetical protein
MKRAAVTAKTRRCSAPCSARGLPCALPSNAPATLPKGVEKLNDFQLTIELSPLSISIADGSGHNIKHMFDVQY